MTDIPDEKFIATREKPGSHKTETVTLGLDEDAGLVNVPSVDAFNEQPVKLGRLPPDIPFLSSVMKVLEKEVRTALADTTIYT